MEARMHAYILARNTLLFALCTLHFICCPSIVSVSLSSGHDSVNCEALYS